MSDEKDFYYSDVNVQKEAIARLLECTQWWPSKREHKVLKGLLAERERLHAELAAMQKQRDEAREEICELVAASDEAITGFATTAKQIAARRGWDCFAQGGGGA